MHVRLQVLAALLGVALMGSCSHPPPPPAAGCFLATRLKGALEAAIDWRGDALLCEGGARPEGRGLRASFAGKGPQAEALRFVFGLAALPGAGESRNVATHLTVIVEGSGKLYATQGDAQCTTELLQQSPLATQPGQWRVRARGYCIDPAATLDASARLYMERFDFEGLARFDPEDLNADRKP
ncbi:MAG: hypothetical protein RL684_1581 [Pseudomonadota bacterium]|jgi:hypothetical protein